MDWRAGIMPADAACGVSFENHLCKRVVFFGWNTHLPRPHASCGSVFVSVKIFSVPVYQRVLRKRGRSDLGCVSPAFRSRFACKWNAELTISKRVIGIFRPRFACLQNSVIQCKSVAVRKGGLPKPGLRRAGVNRPSQLCGLESELKAINRFKDDLTQRA